MATELVVLPDEAGRRLMLVLGMALALVLQCCYRQCMRHCCMRQSSTQAAEVEQPEDTSAEKKKDKKDDEDHIPDNRRNLPTGNVLVTKYGQCWHASRDCKSLRQSRMIDTYRPCCYCCPA